MERVVTQVARFVSMAQLPSARAEARKNSAPFRATGCSARPIAARLMVTKLVSGTASRKPPFSGWMDASTRSVRARVRSRRKWVSGFWVGR